MADNICLAWHMWKVWRGLSCRTGVAYAVGLAWPVLKLQRDSIVGLTCIADMAMPVW